MMFLPLIIGSVITLAPFGELEIVDEVDCVAAADHSFAEFPEGSSRVIEILGRRCRHQPVQDDEVAGWMKFRLGGGKGLDDDGAYVVVMDFPDDVPRNYIIHNRGSGSDRGFSTGCCYGDAERPKYVDNHLEKVELPQSGEWRQWAAFTPLAEGAKDGFDFYVSQYSREHDSISQGVAFSRILLCRMPDESSCAAKIVFPTEGLPRRHIFWREEMSDGGISLRWARNRFRQMAQLGIDTYMKDLLEFGHVQHWDPHWIAENWMWGATRELDYLWERIVREAGDRGLNVLPYYEWSGPREWNMSCRTFGGGEHYTHITWSETNIDITDPRALEETKRLLDATILRFRNDAEFIGALFRTRPTQWAISFSDEALARFGTVRETVRNDKTVYNAYIDWWYRRRAEFLAALRDYLVAGGIDGAMVWLDGEYSESGPGEGSRESPTPTWGEWEWQHACPADRPSVFPKREGSALAMPVNRVYSVSDPALFADYADGAGMTAVIKHTPLNEHMQESLPFYTMNDTEKALGASMMIEALAMANGDVGYLGYLVGSAFTSGFPAERRAFNLNFLALPALPSRRLADACEVDGIVVREIDCGEERYYAIVNASAVECRDIRIKLSSKGAKQVEFIVEGRRQRLSKSMFTIDRLPPWSLVALVRRQ